MQKIDKIWNDVLQQEYSKAKSFVWCFIDSVAITELDGKDVWELIYSSASNKFSWLLLGPYSSSSSEMVLKRHKTRLANHQMKGKVISELDGRSLHLFIHCQLYPRF